MKESTIAKIIPVGLTIIGVVLLYVWLSADAAIDLTERLPIAHDIPQAPSDANGVEMRG